MTKKAVQTKFPLCQSFPGIFSDSTTLDLRQENILTCLAYENVPYMGYFYLELNSTTITDSLIQAFSSSKFFYLYFFLFLRYFSKKN